MRGVRRFGAVQGLFFLSGAAGLVYQVAWTRLLNEVFGVSVHAVTAVLATYLGGLALGSWLLGRAADRWSSPLRLYGLLELGVATTALAGTWIVRAFEPVHVYAANRLAPDSVALLGIRVLLASLVVLPPTILMGGTLPAMTRALVDRIARLGRELSFLYALNTAGAVAGSLAAGFLLIRWIGVHGTLWMAVAVNVVVGAVAIALAPAPAAAPPEGGHRASASVHAGPELEAQPLRGERWILVAMALSGFASLSLEVIWTRVLVLVFGTSTYAFVTMLSAFLVGIALGSFLARLFVDRLADAYRVFGWVQVGIALSTLGTIPLMGALVSSWQSWFDGHELQWLALAAGRFGVSFAVMIVPTTLVGMTFPLAGKIWARGVATLGNRLGQVYGANTVGNIAGAVVGGMVLLPALGMQRGVAVVTVLNLAAAAGALLHGGGTRRRIAFLLRAAPLAAGLLACAFLLVAWQPPPFVTSEEGDADPVLYYREGSVSTVKVIQRAADGRQRLMLVDGIRIGQSTTGVDRKQQVLAHFPFLLERGGGPAEVLTIGLGTGILAGEVARHPGVARVDCVELSPSVIEGARWFEEYNFGVLHDPKVRIVNDDGVNFLRRSTARYHAIISDGKSRSGHAGNALFYSEDYYRSGRDHLGPDGVMIQWVPLDVPPGDLRTILRTFTRVFPHAYLWLAQDSCFVAGAQRPLVLDLGHVAKALAASEVADLWRHGWRSADDVATLLVADAPALQGWLSQEDEVNTLEHPVLEFYSPRSLAVPERQRVAENLAAILATRRGPLQDVMVAGADRAEVEARAGAVRRVLEAIASSEQGSEEGLARLEAAVAAAPDNGVLRQWAATTLFNLARDRDLSGDIPGAAALYSRALGAWPGLLEAHLNLGRVLASQGRLGEAMARFRMVLEANPFSGTAHAMLGEALQAAGQPDAALAHFQEALRIAPAQADVHDVMGLAFFATGRFHEALVAWREAARLRPSWAQPIEREALLLATDSDPRHRDVEEAIRLARRATELTGSRDARALEVLAVAYAAAGRFVEATSAERSVIALATSARDAALAGEATEALHRYERGLPPPPLPPPAPSATR